QQKKYGCHVRSCAVRQAGPLPSFFFVCLTCVGGGTDWLFGFGVSVRPIAVDGRRQWPQSIRSGKGKQNQWKKSRRCRTRTTATVSSCDHYFVLQRPETCFFYDSTPRIVDSESAEGQEPTDRRCDEENLGYGVLL